MMAGIVRSPARELKIVAYLPSNRADKSGHHKLKTLRLHFISRGSLAEGEIQPYFPD